MKENVKISKDPKNFLYDFFTKQICNLFCLYGLEKMKKLFVFWKSFL